MERTKTDLLLTSAHTADIITFIGCHSGCSAKDIYRNKTRNAHTRERLALLESTGLLEIEEDRGRVFLMLTPAGEAVAGHLDAIEDILRSRP